MTVEEAKTNGVSELKPCPFCGGTNISIDGDTPVASCETCFCMTRNCATAEMAIEEWNRRADPAPLRKWEPGSEPPHGWYWWHYDSRNRMCFCTGYALTKIDNIRNRDNVSWTHGAGYLYGPIPEPETEGM